MKRLTLSSPLHLWAGSFLRNESGAAAVSYVLMLPLVFGLFLLTLDSGFTTMRASLLDRAVDITARSIRNGTLASPTLATTKTDLCRQMSFFPDCSAQLKVQIIAVSRTDFAMPQGNISCADQGASITPVRTYVVGQANPVAILGACMDIVTFTPGALIANRPFSYSIRSGTAIAGAAS